MPNGQPMDVPDDDGEDDADQFEWLDKDPSEQVARSRRRMTRYWWFHRGQA